MEDANRQEETGTGGWRKSWMRFVVLCAAAALVFLLGIMSFGSSLYCCYRESHSRSESIALLKGSKTLEQYKPNLAIGTWLDLQDGSWIAIRYQDGHGPNIWSMAVAVDSSGQWYESRKHFCRLFMGYHYTKRQAAQLIEEKSKAGEAIAEDLLREQEGRPPLGDIERCPSLDSARPLMEKLGFTRTAQP